MNALISSYSRRVGPDEWTYVGMGVPNVCQQVLEGEGEVTAEALAAAVEKAAAVCPGTRLRRRRRRWIDSGVPPAVRVVELRPGEELFAHPALHTTLNDGGPTFEVLLVRQAGQPLRLVFRGFHAVSDARGIHVWASDVFRALRGEEPLGAPSDWNIPDFLHHLMPEGPPPIAEGTNKPDWPSSMAPVVRGARALTWRRRTVVGNHASVTAKVIAAIAALRPTGTPERFFVPVDLRRHQPDLRSTGWLSLSVDLDVASGTGWEQIHEDLLTALAERRELSLRTPSWLLRMPRRVVRLIADSMEENSVKTERYMGTATVSSLGAVDLADYSTESFRATTVYVLGGCGPSSPPCVDVVESAGRTEIVLSWRDVPGGAEPMDAFLDHIVESLSPRADREPAANDTGRELPSSRSLLRLFRDHVERSPDAIALTGPDGDVTYRELSLRADAVADALRARGAGR
ncbi:non-ribosomal peptide synthetase, partial [Streptomyces sp. S6]